MSAWLQLVLGQCDASAADDALSRSLAVGEVPSVKFWSRRLPHPSLNLTAQRRGLSGVFVITSSPTFQRKKEGSIGSKRCLPAHRLEHRFGASRLLGGVHKSGYAQRCQIPVSIPDLPPILAPTSKRKIRQNRKHGTGNNHQGV